jgi:hypothetical protein
MHTRAGHTNNLPPKTNRSRARYRFLSSTLIIRLIGGSAQQILRSLQLLFHQGYLDRSTSQVAQLAHAFDFGNLWPRPRRRGTDSRQD